MKLDRIILNNFLTYSHLDYSFESKPMLVQGVNLTDDNQKSNGSGKSGMQTGIEFCITASNSRDVRDQELITFGYDEARAQLYASCDIRKQSIHIDWTIRLKGSNKVNISIKPLDSDEWEEVSFSNVNDGKKYIIDWFDISKEDLFNYYLINKTRFKSFFKSSNREKVDLINRFSDASIIEGLEKIDNSELEASYRSKQREIDVISGKIESKEEYILAEKNRDLEADLNEKKAAISEEIADEEWEIEDEKEKIIAIKDKISNISNVVDKSNSEITSLESKKSEISLRIESINKEIEKYDSQIEEAENIVDNFERTDWKKERHDYEEDIKEDEANLREALSRLKASEERSRKIKDAIAKNNSLLAGSIECPNCSHKWNISEGISVEEIELKIAQIKSLEEKNKKESEDIEVVIKDVKKAKSDIEQIISEINKKEQEENREINKLVDSVNELKRERINKITNELNREQRNLNSTIAEITEVKALIQKTKDSESTLKNNIKNIETKIELCKKNIKNLKSNINNLKVESNEERISILEKEKSDLDSTKSILEKEYASIGDQIYERNKWSNNFKHFRMYLANQSLETISYHCNRYLKDMGSDMIVELNGYKVLANGTLKEEISTTVIRGVERTFSSFSGGEQGRLLFASILANRHMINSTHKYGGLDFLSIDEVFEGVDSVGLKHLVNSAKSLNVSVMIITHVTDEETSDNVLTIVKENGVSKIKK